MFKIKKRKRYVAEFVIKEQGIYNKQHRRPFKPNGAKIKIGKGLYLINPESPSYIDGLSNIYVIDLVTGVQVSYRKLQKSQYSPRMLNLMVGEEVVKDLVGGMGKKPAGMNIMTLIIGIALGGAFGYIIGGIF